MSEPYENTLSVGELRKELRRAWDERNALIAALRDLPEMPPTTVMKQLASAAKFPKDWELGNIIQRANPWGVVPAKTEYEMGMGFYSRVRQGLLAAEVEDSAA